MKTRLEAHYQGDTHVALSAKAFAVRGYVFGIFAIPIHEAFIGCSPIVALQRITERTHVDAVIIDYGSSRLIGGRMPYIHMTSRSMSRQRIYRQSLGRCLNIADNKHRCSTSPWAATDVDFETSSTLTSLANCPSVQGLREA
jgi:hypothetical protein